MESLETAYKRAALDLASIGVQAGGGLRRSSPAALTWGDVELWADGTGQLTVQGERTWWNRQWWQSPGDRPRPERFGSSPLILRLRCSVSSARPLPTRVRATAIAQPTGLDD